MSNFHELKMQICTPNSFPTGIKETLFYENNHLCYLESFGERISLPIEQ